MSGKLEDLLISNSDITSILYNTLKDFVRIEKEKGALHFLERFEQLGASEKIITVLISSMVRSKLGFPESEDEGRPKWIAQLTGLPPGTVKPSLRTLLSKYRIVEQNNDGRYYVPEHAVARIHQQFFAKQSHDS